MALCVAAGLPWAGHEVIQAPVLYISVEVSAGLSKRLKAGAKAKGITLPPDFHIITEAVNFLEPKESAALREAITERGVKYGLIVIDTLARCMPGGDENSAKDMGIAVDAITELAHETGATVLVLHHVTNSTGSIRGSSALPGALDTLIKAERNGDSLTLTCVKQKDADEFEPHYFASEVVNIGSDVSSLVLTRTSEGPPQAEQPTRAAKAYDKVLTILKTLGGGREVRRDAWEAECVRQHIPQRTFARHASELVKDGLITKREVSKKETYYAPAFTNFERAIDEDEEMAKWAV